jgi:Flp pilus assembly protein TadD
LIALGRGEEALAQFREALRLSPDNPKTHYHLGCALARLGRSDEAVAELLSAIHLRADYVEARQKLRELGVNAP